MVDDLRFVVTFVSVLGCGLMAGILFAFSAFLMNAFGRLPPPQGIAAMQSINIAIINPWFLTVFLGTAVACVFLAISSLLMWHRPGSGWQLAGALLYLVGTLLVTIVFNIPRNDALAAANPASADSARVWADYLSSWTAWNHVRAAAALVAAALLTMALCSSGAGRAV